MSLGRDRRDDLCEAYGHKRMPYLRSFWHALRDRFEQSGSRPVKTFTWDPSTPEGKHELESLLMSEQEFRPGLVNLRITTIEDALRRQPLRAHLREVLEAVTGKPLRDKPAERRAQDAGWVQLKERTMADVADDPDLTAWCVKLWQQHRLQCISKSNWKEAETLWQEALPVVRALRRLKERTLLTVFAAETCNRNAKALEKGKALGTLVVRAAAQIAGFNHWEENDQRHNIWRAFGILDDTVSSKVLVLNLRGMDDSVLGHSLTCQSAHGRVRTVTLHELSASRLRFDRSVFGPEVYVCENPGVIESAASHPRANAHPMVCINGQPHRAAHRLLELICKAGIRIHYHGDFDWWGIRIGNDMYERYAAIPWHFSASDYQPGQVQLIGTPVEAQWDHRLQAVMQQADRAMHEEAAWPQLRADLFDPRTAESHSSTHW